MTVLLDTHALLWWLTDDPRLSPVARRTIADESIRVLASAASAWEIATKHRLGKLGLAASIVQRYPALIEAEGFDPLPISVAHALHAGSYPQDHRDPFDRVLAAQAELEKVPLVTSDPAMSRFGVDVLW